MGIHKTHKSPRGTKYLLDEEGYAVVVLKDSIDDDTEEEIVEEEMVEDTTEEEMVEDTTEEETVEDTTEEETNDQEREPSFIDAIPPEYIKAADEGSLTQKMLLDMEYTDVVRLGAYPPANKVVWDLVGIRGAPLRWGTDKITKEPLPKEKVYRFRPSQQKAIDWMKSRERLDTNMVYGLRGGILVLKMGMGKTLCALAHSLTSAKGEFPTLVVASKTVMNEWKSEGVDKFFGQSIKVLYLHQDFIGKDIHTMTRKRVLEYDLVITTYDACVQASRKGEYHKQCFEMGDDHTLMKGKILSVHLRTKEQANLPKVTGMGVIYGTPWERVICDESQRFANPDTQTYKCMMAIYGKYKWCLTGTPIRNYQTDIWAQLRFCGYTGVKQTIVWKRQGTTKFREHKLTEAIFSMDYKAAKIELPPKTSLLKFVSLKGKQKEAYDHIQGVARKLYDDMMKSLCSFACVLAMFTRLRQCAIAPYLITAESKREKLKGASAKADKEAVELLKKMTTGGLGAWCHEKGGEAGIYAEKISEIINIIAKIPKGEKVLVFSMFTSCLDLLADALEVRLPDFRLVQIDGDTKGKERATILEEFRTDPEVRGLFLTYKVGSEGLNLTEGTHCICIEPWWTPAVPDQAEARCWRTGQTKPVFIHNVLVQNTIEEKVIAICKEKQEMASSYLEGTERPLGKVGLDKYTLGRILGIL